MQLVIAAVGSRMPAWVDLAFDDYATRMPADLRIVLREVRPESRTGGKSVAAMMGAEGERLRAALPRHGARIALDERGRDVTSNDLAAMIGTWRADGDDVAFLIGGPDGLEPAIKAECTARLRLSSLTLPHGMARVLLAEQLYRAWSITQNHPYHRA
jgi:23S rRNA (pseudouridine1915-N3)-methyltransferase